MSSLIVSKNPQTSVYAYINPNSGDAYLSDNLICNLLGMQPETLMIIIEKEDIENYASKHTQVKTEGGLLPVRTLRIASDLAVILQAWSPASAIKVVRKETILYAMMDAGANGYVYSICGYVPKPKTTITHSDWVDVVRECIALDNSNLSDDLKKTLLEGIMNSFLADKDALNN